MLKGNSALLGAVSESPVSGEMMGDKDELDEVRDRPRGLPSICNSFK